MKLIVDKKRGGPQYRDVSDNNNEPKMKMKYETFQTFAEAEAASSDEQKQHIADARDYNKREARRTIADIAETSTEFIVAGGWIFYITPSIMPNESGLKFLNELNLVCSIMCNSSFYRVIKTNMRIGLMTDPRDPKTGNSIAERQRMATEPWGLSRSMEARKTMAEKYWTLTTSSKFYHLAEESDAVLASA